MAMNLDREIVVSLRCQAVSTCPDGLTRVPCLSCHAPLDIHQPDPNHSHRMLGTCGDCGRWHLIECRPNHEDGPTIVALLPETLSP